MKHQLKYMKVWTLYLDIIQLKYALKIIFTGFEALLEKVVMVIKSNEKLIRGYKNVEGDKKKEEEGELYGSGAF